LNRRLFSHSAGGFFCLTLQDEDLLKAAYEVETLIMDFKDSAGDREVPMRV
jgi:hypothetical protein